MDNKSLNKPTPSFIRLKDRDATLDITHDQYSVVSPDLNHLPRRSHSFSTSITAPPELPHHHPSHKQPSIYTDQQSDDDSIVLQHHWSHPQHPLVQDNFPYLFTCMGCKEYGAGNCFSCQTCTNFKLHHFCAMPSPSLNSHLLHPHHQLVFFAKPVKGGIVRGRCDICSRAIKGFAYRCGSCSFQMHPCCAQLSTVIKISTHIHPLRLHTASSGGEGQSGTACNHCNKKRSSGRGIYRCAVCDYSIHAACAKNMFNGLYANDIDPPEKPSVLGAAARIATHVVVGFIGGLVEGIGEGVGDVLVQSIVKTRRRDARSSPAASSPQLTQSD